jgi:lipid-binding SYLF domain-containing protein
MNIKSACIIAALGTFGALGATSCATAPRSAEGRANLKSQANQTLHEMRSVDPSLDGLLSQSAGYAVFPSIGKAGFIGGAGYGRGVLFERGQPVGFVDMKQASFGLQAGAQTFAEVIIFRNPWDVQNLKTGTFRLGANASAVVLTAGAGAKTNFERGVAVIVRPHGGAMAELSVSGQQMSFRPLSG